MAFLGVRNCAFKIYGSGTSAFSYVRSLVQIMVQMLSTKVTDRI